MSITVIYSNMGDTDTAVLKEIWKGVENVNVVEVNHRAIGWRGIVDSAIANEHDTLIFCGHGSPGGLFSPTYDGVSTYLVSARNMEKICAKNVIGIWCHASSFAEQNNLHGFYSSMFISNENEAYDNGIYNSSDEEITCEEVLFCNRVNRLIKESVPLSEWCRILKSECNMEDPVVKFNYEGLRYFG